MKLLAQHGYGEGDKINLGLENEIIEGIILSPRDIDPSRIQGKINDYRKIKNDANIFFDPQFYVSILNQREAQSIGNLMEYEYFKFNRRSTLERENNVLNHIRNIINYQNSLDITSLISPNITISNSFDSISSLISRNFISLSKQVCDELRIDKEIYSTLSISTDALTDNEELQMFLNEITSLDNPPDGFYILISSVNVDNRFEIFDRDVIRGWLLLNYSLKVNGFKILNGYSDIITPFLGAVGADFGATGWYANLRTFSLSKFNSSSSVRRQPLPRYLSTNLINRITHQEFNLWKESVPNIINDLETDDYFESEEPTRTEEVLQNWEALSELNEDLSESLRVDENIDNSEEAIQNAINSYLEIQLSFRPENKSSSSHLTPLLEGITNFRNDAQI